jgi:pimeloyl-ACP methyl ester carboxylesterase
MIYLILWTIAILLVALISTVATFAMARYRYGRKLRNQSAMIQTERGPIEYAEIGHGAPILVVHGSPGGFDQSLNYILALQELEFKYRYIIPSRAGYLRTPLSVAKTPLEQAHAFAALLTALGIDRVVTTASSGGGPSALEFAMRYPDRGSALILEECITQKVHGNPAPIRASIFRDYLVWLVGRIRVAQWQASSPGDRKISTLGNALMESIGLSRLRSEGEANDFIQFSRIADWPLNQITCPTLILHGTADANVPISHSEFAHSQISGSTRLRLEITRARRSTERGARWRLQIVRLVRSGLETANS